MPVKSCHAKNCPNPPVRKRVALSQPYCAYHHSLFRNKSTPIYCNRRSDGSLDLLNSSLLEEDGQVKVEIVAFGRYKNGNFNYLDIQDYTILSDKSEVYSSSPEHDRRGKNTSESEDSNFTSNSPVLLTGNCDTDQHHTQKDGQMSFVNHRVQSQRLGNPNTTNERFQSGSTSSNSKMAMNPHSSLTYQSGIGAYPRGYSAIDMAPINEINKSIGSLKFEHQTQTSNIDESFEDSGSFIGNPVGTSASFYRDCSSAMIEIIPTFHQAATGMINEMNALKQEIASLRSELDAKIVINKDLSDKLEKCTKGRDEALEKLEKFRKSFEELRASP